MARAGPSRSVDPLPGGKIRFSRLSVAFTLRSWLVPQFPHVQARSRLSFAFTAWQVLQVLLLGYQTGARVTSVNLQLLLWMSCRLTSPIPASAWALGGYSSHHPCHVEVFYDEFAELPGDRVGRLVLGV